VHKSVRMAHTSQPRRVDMLALMLALALGLTFAVTSAPTLALNFDSRFFILLSVLKAQARGLGPRIAK
jgi:hypothetical protein